MLCIDWTEAPLPVFFARCWQVICVWIAPGQPADSGVCHSVASLHIPLYCLFGPEANISTLSDTQKHNNMLEYAQLVFSSELEIWCLKNHRNWAVGHVGGVGEGRRFWVGEDKEISLHANMET